MESSAKTADLRKLLLLKRSTGKFRKRAFTRCPSRPETGLVMDLGGKWELSSMGSRGPS